MRSIDSNEKINKELAQFLGSLNLILPRFLELSKKSVLNDEEKFEIGEIEHNLIGINAKISELKNSLDHALYGHVIDTYYKLKDEMKNGDDRVLLKYEHLKSKFTEFLFQENLINWN